MILYREKNRFKAGEGKLGTDESELIRILASRSFPQLRATFEAYNRIADKDIASSIKSETRGNLEDALVAIGLFYVYYSNRNC
jgi:hypothetical protein